MAGILDILTNKLNNSLSNLYNADKIGQLEYNAGRDYGYKNTASGPVSDFRHQAAMNELSKSLGPNALSVGVNPFCIIFICAGAWTTLGFGIGCSGNGGVCNSDLSPNKLFFSIIKSSGFI